MFDFLCFFLYQIHFQTQHSKKLSVKRTDTLVGTKNFEPFHFTVFFLTHLKCLETEVRK